MAWPRCASVSARESRSSSSVSDGPLTGLRVLEFGNLIAAPYATMLLADLGADVVKVEPPGGDLARRFGPFRNGESIFFMAVNRGKRSIVVDDDRPLLEALIERADALVHNLRQGAMERLGVGPAHCHEINPSLVYTEITAFGDTGPYAGRSGVDIVFQGESGMISITGDAGDPPHKTATTIADYLAGTNAALTTAAAMAERPPTGRHIVVTLRDGVMAAQSGWNALYLERETEPERTGTASPFLAPNQVFKTADGNITIAVVSDRHFAALAEALDMPHLAAEFPDNETRVRRLSDLAAVLDTVFATKPTSQWLSALEEKGIPAGRVLTIGEALSDPQAIHHEMVVEQHHPTVGIIRVTGSPLRIDGRPARASTPAPVLGGDNDAIEDWLS